MSDKKDALRRTRDGQAVGAHLERKMSAKVGDEGIRTAIETDAIGGDTVMKIVDGHAHYFNNPEEEEAEIVDDCPLTDYGFVNSNLNAFGVYGANDHLDWPLYTLFDENGSVKKAKYARNSSARKNTLMWQAAPLFSGAMRRVVQMENGKKSGPLPLGEGESPFYPGWSTSDGLFIGLSASGVVVTRYIIRINASGIWRIPVTFCKVLPVNWKTQESSWKLSLSASAFHTTVSPYWTVKTFKPETAVKIGDAPPCFADGFAPFYSWCGWAFNYEGTKATVVCTGFATGSDTWLTNRMYDITISHFDGIPTSATTTLTESGIFNNPLNDGVDGTYNAALQSATTLPGYLDTYTFHDTFSSAPDQDTPVYSYYESSGSKVIVRFKYTNGGVVVTTRTTTYQTPETIYLSPVGTIAATGLVGGVVTITPIEVYPEPAMLAYSTGLVSITLSGGSYGTVGPCFYSPHASVVGVSYSSPSVTELALESAGYGYMQYSGEFIGGRMPSERCLFCVLGFSVYGADKPYYAYPPNSSTDVDLFDRFRYVNYAWQVTTTYSATIGEKSVLLMHGFDRESYAVATYRSEVSSTKTSAKSTSGPLGGFTMIPIGPMTIGTPNGPQPFSPYLTFKTTVTDEGTNNVTGIGGWEFSPGIEGKVVSVGNNTISGGTSTSAAINSVTRTLMVRVGETSISSTLETNNLFRTYVGNLFMFRACAAAWENSRIVRATEATSPLTTDGLGGVKPGSSITSFIGVF